jgi:uncharacterized protein (DUF302 family)
LPCNVVVCETEGATRASAINAGAMLGIVDDSALDEVAEDL